MEYLEIPHLLCAIQNETNDLPSIEGLFPIVHSANEASSTAELLEYPSVLEAISQRDCSNIVVVPYVNDPDIERACQQQSFALFAPPAKLVHDLEEKESAHVFLGEACPEALIPATIQTFGECQWEPGSKGYAIQRTGKVFSGGKGTELVLNEEQWNELSIPQDAMVKSSPFIEGPSLNINACVVDAGTIVTDPSFQIIGPPECSVNSSAYCGNDWEAAKSLPSAIIRNVYALTNSLGDTLQGLGYRGWFGLDLIIDDKTNHVYVIEVNPRFQGSTSLLTITQCLQGLSPMVLYHLLSHANASQEVVPEAVTEQYRDTGQGSHIIVRAGAEPTKYKTVCTPGVYRSQDEQWQHTSSEVQYERAKDEEVVVHGTPPLGKEIPAHDRLFTIQSSRQVLEGLNSSELTEEMKQLTGRLRGMFSLS